MFMPENDLERLLVRASEDPAQRAPFLKAFLDAELAFALVDTGDPKEGYVVPEVTHDEIAFVPVFTADSRVGAMFGEDKLKLIRQTFRQILGQIEDANFVLNPGSEHGHEFMAEDVASMLDGDFERAAESFDHQAEGPDGDLPTLVGQPSPAATHLTKPLAALFATIPEVRRAHMAQAVFADSAGFKRLVIGLAVDGDMDDVLDRMGDVLAASAKQSDVIDFVPVPGSPLDGYFERDAQPFYRKA